MWSMHLIMYCLIACSITFSLLGFGNLQCRLTNAVYNSQTRQIHELDEQVKQKIISEMTSAATKTTEYRVKPSLKRALPQEFLDKTIDEVVKCLTSSSIPEFKAKGNKNRFEANNEILEKIDQAISSMLLFPLVLSISSSFWSYQHGSKVFFFFAKDISNTVILSKEISLQKCELDQDWEHSKNCNELISVRGRLKQNQKCLKKVESFWFCAKYYWECLRIAFFIKSHTFSRKK